MSHGSPLVPGESLQAQMLRNKQKTRAFRTTCGSLIATIRDFQHFVHGSSKESDLGPADAAAWWQQGANSAVKLVWNRR
jgi:hypothetical protein